MNDIPTDAEVLVSTPGYGNTYVSLGEGWESLEDVRTHLTDEWGEETPGEYDIYVHVGDHHIPFPTPHDGMKDSDHQQLETLLEELSSHPLVEGENVRTPSAEQSTQQIAYRGGMKLQYAADEYDFVIRLDRDQPRRHNPSRWPDDAAGREPNEHYAHRLFADIAADVSAPIEFLGYKTGWVTRREEERYLLAVGRLQREGDGIVEHVRRAFSQHDDVCLATTGRQTDIGATGFITAGKAEEATTEDVDVRVDFDTARPIQLTEDDETPAEFETEELVEWGRDLAADIETDEDVTVDALIVGERMGESTGSVVPFVGYRVQSREQS